MRIKTFEAQTMKEALALARRELGEEAVVLNTKHVKAGGILGLRGGTKVELMAAVDEPALVEAVPSAGAFAAQAYAPPVPSTPSITQEPDVEINQLRSEVNELGALVRSLTRPAEAGPMVDVPLLVRAGVDELLMHGPLADLANIEDPLALASALAGKMQAFAAPPTLDGRQVIAFVGPTGVGKTTTLAKLAARLSLEKRVKVALVTADTYRIGAVEQLRTYARIMGLPLEVALSPEEVAAAIEKHSDKDVILVDTVGRSQRSDEHLAELKSFVDAAQPTETYLVVAASLSDSTQDEVVEKFKILSPTRLVVTKLDETADLGCLVNLPLGTGLGISCLTAGQNVPQDIDFADAGIIARLVVGVD